MKCPLCAVDLNMSERSGVEIDYCPNCRGVWLDRGELDKIIELSLTAAPAVPTSEPYGGSDQPPRRSREYEKSNYDEPYRGQRKKREGWLGELFDFGD